MLVVWAVATFDWPKSKAVQISPSSLKSRRYIEAPIASLLASEKAWISLLAIFPKPVGW